MNAKVLKLFITTKEKTRVKVNTIVVDSQGIKDDKFYSKNSQRAILITSTMSYDLAKSNAITILDGALGENILLNINPCNLAPGDILTIGDTRLEITQNCTICKGLSSIDAKLPKLLKTDRGIFAKALSNNSSINIGDKVTISHI